MARPLVSISEAELIIDNWKVILTSENFAGNEEGG